MPPCAITLRPATRADLPRMVRILLDAFAFGPWGRYLFPPHLKVKPGDGDEFDWRLSMISSGFDDPGREHVLACEGADGEGKQEILGWAQWVDSGAVPAGQMKSPEGEKKETKAESERPGTNPAGLDTAALDRMTREGQHLEKTGEECLRAEGSNDSWLLNYLVIDPKHQRKGIGRRLTQDGLDRAGSQGRDVRLRASPQGRQLYLTMGFEDVCEGKVAGGSQYALVWRASDRMRAT